MNEYLPNHLAIGSNRRGADRRDDGTTGFCRRDGRLSMKNPKYIEFQCAVGSFSGQE
jgi:hypothetical protein